MLVFPLLTGLMIPGVYSYEGLGRVVFGKKWGHLPVCIAIMMQNLGAMISYMVGATLGLFQR